MRFVIRHEMKGRIRVHMAQPKMTYRQADTLLYFLESLAYTHTIKVYELTADAVIEFEPEKRAELIQVLRQFQYDHVEPPQEYLESSTRQLNAEYREKLLEKCFLRCLRRFLPAPVRHGYTLLRAIPYVRKGLQCLRRRHVEVPVLDAMAIGVSLCRRDFNTASSVMFLLGIGEILEEWTHKKSVEDLARSLSLKAEKVWRKEGDAENLVSVKEIAVGDEVMIHMSGVIPFDGIVTAGEAMINQASMTGESLPVKKMTGSYVYAGTVVEEGEITFQVKEVAGSTRMEKIIQMIEDSEKLKSAVESQAEHLADRLVPYTFLGTGIAWFLTRNITRALAVLMVDFSCALKLAMPITVLSAIREANQHKITVKGGKYLEAMSSATTLVLDKTGTLTKARPTVHSVIAFGNQNPEEMLRMAACLEEHFPHSMAKAVVREAKKRHLEHEEMHSKVEYIVAHGIVSHVGEHRVIIGSHHFVFEDEKCRIRPEDQERFEMLPTQYSHLYMAMDFELAAVICIEDPLRKEASDVIRALRKEGFQKIVMMTGDSERTAKAIAEEVGVDTYYAEVLPEDKAAYIQKEREHGQTVVMVGDGINDSPALSEANVGIAMQEGAEIAREIADITISGECLMELVNLRRLSHAMMKRIQQNYHSILGVNGGLILLGVAGIIQPTTSAFFHNLTTLILGLRSMRHLLPEE
ncbi:MAG TPA: heavy metal translocating P-type ATPase [Candidatus Faecimorpha stercoravium]|nr:heavy metal translocating P-type ATPase [Candidatus Faecimorpha stercoravium]